MKDKTIRFIDSQYNDLFTIPDGGNIELTFLGGEKVIRKCTYIDDYHTKVGHNVFHICEFAEKMERQGAKYIPVFSEKEQNEAFILHLHNEFQKDKFYVSPQSQTVTMVYYNPDSYAGGQLVYNNISYENVKEAAKFKDKNKFFDYLGSCCKQTLVDIDTPEFKDCAYSFINKTCDFVESNINTMKALLKISGAEKSRTTKHKEMER
ncbi:MAG: hypothetical protein GX800_11225 [Clostridiaceae bacterium]|nr:hypothetical protein [Clostridiaceae bacterium]